MIWLIFAHYIGDCAFQHDLMGQLKEKYLYGLFVHSMVWTACICVALEYQGRFTIAKVAFLVIGHMMIDKWRTAMKRRSDIRLWTWIDQALHFLQCAVAWVA